jgi:hypothetical protein
MRPNLRRHDAAPVIDLLDAESDEFRRWALSK